MAWTLGGEDATGFHDGATGDGHVYTFPAGAPSVADWDVLFVNSNTTLAITPAGFTRTLDLIASFGANNQGAYALTRKAAGGESNSVTIKMSGNNNTILNWQRWQGGNTLDVATAAVADASPASVTPAVSTGTLADAGELVIACAALQGSFPTVTPSWGAGYTPGSGTQYNAGTVDEVSSYIGYRTDGGTTAETPQADWTTTPTAPISDRYIMVLAFTPAATGTSAEATPATITTTAAVPTPSVSAQRQAAATPATITAAAAVPAPGILAVAAATPATITTITAVPAPNVDVETSILLAALTMAATVATPAVAASASITLPAITLLAGVPAPRAGQVVPFGGYGTLTATSAATPALTPAAGATSTLTATTVGRSTLLATVAP